MPLGGLDLQDREVREDLAKVLSPTHTSHTWHSPLHTHGGLTLHELGSMHTDGSSAASSLSRIPAEEPGETGQPLLGLKRRESLQCAC